MATAIQDFFPIDGARATFAEAHRIFEVAGRRRITWATSSSTIRMAGRSRGGEATYRWLARWLQGREDDGAEPEFKLDSAEGSAVQRDRPGGTTSRRRRDCAIP